MNNEFMKELEDVMMPKESEEVVAEDAPVKMQFKKKLKRTKKKDSADEQARKALKGPEAKEMK